MKIVKFEDGTYAVRKGWFNYKYYDNCDVGEAWKKQTWPLSLVKNCKVKTFAEAQAIVARLKNNPATDYGTPVDVMPDHQLDKRF